ncbi:MULTISPECIES: DUF4350 domain-containing protein [Paraliobacillus]|uniref:DUF4350 domain-containing protein n=1 Tax=Paraliobacillus TaxID=200903 RepID=UPI000DD3C482|nr:MULTISPECIES: DUF4350 domain-containing protein [Paraliobacillus]
MPQGYTQRNIWIWLVSLLVLFILLSFFLFKEGPEEYPAYISESPAPMGTKAFYTYLNQEGFDAERWINSPESLAQTEENELLFMIAPPLFADEVEQESYQTYMEAGNTIVLLRQNPDGMFDLDTSYIEGELTEESTTLNGIGTYEALLQSPFRVKTKDDDNVLLMDEEGEAIAIERDYGKGKLIVITEPNWLTNETITENEHVDIVLNLVDVSTYSSIKFDEYVHGAGERISIFTLYPRWLLTFTVELIILTLLWLWLKGKRFGPVIEPREATVRFSDERLKALAIWYIKGKRYQDALSVQASYNKQLLQERYGIPYRKSWEDSIDAIHRALTDMSRKEIETYINGLNEILVKEKITKQEFVAWSQKNDRIRKEVEEG